MPKFLGEIVQNGGDFALLDSSNVRGGFMQVGTIAERDSIIPDKLKVGMLVYVEETHHIYKWEGDTWAIFEVNSNDIKNCQFLTTCQKVAERTEPIPDEYGEPRFWGIRFEGDLLFKGGDLIGWDISASGDGTINGTFTKIAYVANGIAYIERTVNNYLPAKYDTVYLVGSTTDIVRRCVMVLHPYHGAMVLSQFLNISLDNINTNYTFRLGQHGVNYWKIYGEDVYFKGTFVDDKGRNLSDALTLNQETISTGLTGVRREFGYENLLNNPYFIGGMDCWLTKNTATYFKAAGKFIMTNKTLLSAKRDGAYIIVENGQSVLRLINGYISQKNSNLKQFTNLDTKVSPYYVTLIFQYKVIKPGKLKVSIQNETSDGYTEPQTAYKAEQDLPVNNNYHTFRASFLWNGSGDFKLEFNGEIKIQTLVIKVNEVKTFEKQYEDLFKYSDTLVQMAKEYLGET